MKKQLIVTAVVFLFASIQHKVYAQNEVGKVKLDPKKPIRIEYNYPPWNKDPHQIDTANILVKEAKTGKLLWVQLQETGENTNQFEGYYSINYAIDEVIPEIYIAPQKTATSVDELRKAESMIREGKLLRKPFFMRTVKGLQHISVFDSREQALQAYEAYRENLKGKPVVDPAALEAQRKAALAAEVARQAAAAAVQAQERARVEAEEKRKQEELKKQQEALSAQEKAKRKAEAKKLAEQAMDHYRKEEYPEAVDLFKKSLELDPSNSDYYFKYGISLFRVDKYNDSLVALNLAKDSEGANLNELTYYKALNLMRLKESDAAERELETVKASNDKTMAPSAAYFIGVIEFSREQYDKAKPYFEYVLDNSQDTRLDNQADSYIEQIARIKEFEAQRGRKFLLGASMGVTYDSNILLEPSSGDVSVTDKAGYRGNFIGTAEWRPIYTEVHEFSTALMIYDIYSMDKNFKASTDFQKADPLMYSLTLPYKYKGQMWGKGFQSTLTPGYDDIFMDVLGEGSRKSILTSAYIKTDNTFVMSDDWFATYSLELRNDYSTLAGVADDDRASAFRTTLSTTQLLFQDKKKTEAWIGDGSLSQNNAVGPNQSYTKLEVGGTYMTPSYWDTSWTTRLGLYFSNYAQNSDKRQDSDLSLTTGWRKPFWETWAATLTMNYTVNNSNVEADKYDKYTIATLFSWNGGF